MAQESSNRRLKFITGADSFGCALKDSLVSELRNLKIEVEDIGTDRYYSVGEEIGRRISQAAANSDPAVETRGLVACGTGAGVSMFANKFPGVYAVTCLTPGDSINARSINDCNVLAVSGTSTDPETAKEILHNFINTPFKSPCPASGSKPWPYDIQSFLDSSVSEMPKIGKLEGSSFDVPCALCYLGKNRVNSDFVPIEIMPGGLMKIIRETPTSAIVRFKAGSLEPAHHHTFGHDLVVIKGSKTVWNLTKGAKYDLVSGDYLFTPAGDVHRVRYIEDTEFFIKWDGHWDIFLDEDLDAAKAAVEKDN